MKHIKTISEFHQFRGLPKPEHPLISVTNVENTILSSLKLNVASWELVSL